MKHLFSIAVLVVLSSFNHGKLEKMQYATTASSATAKAKVKFTTDFELYYTNYTWAQGYTVELNNIGTNQTYNYNISSYGGTLGTIPAGTYNITLASGYDMYYRKFSICGYSCEGNGGGSMTYVPLEESCSTLVIGWP